jgi:hypothetical protein
MNCWHQFFDDMERGQRAPRTVVDWCAGFLLFCAVSVLLLATFWLWIPLCMGSWWLGRRERLRFEREQPILAIYTRGDTA